MNALLWSILRTINDLCCILTAVADKVNKEKRGATIGADTPTAAINEQERSADELAELHSNSAPGRAFRDRLRLTHNTLDRVRTVRGV